MMAWVASTLGFQPEIVPSSVAKMNWLAKDFPPLLMTKSGVLLNTLPVGAAVFTPAGVGIVTAGMTGMTGMPLLMLLLVLYRVERPVPLSETCQGPFGL